MTITDSESSLCVSVSQQTDFYALIEGYVLFICAICLHWTDSSRIPKNIFKYLPLLPNAHMDHSLKFNVK